MEEETRGFEILLLILTNRNNLVKEVAVRVALGESDRVMPESLISKGTKAECSCTYTLDLRKPNFNKHKTMISKVP